MFIGPCIIVIVEELKTYLTSLAILFHFLCAHMFRTLIYPSSGACDCVDELPHQSSCSQFVVCFSLQNEHHLKPAAPKAPTHNQLRTRWPM